jgi:hypothetical protein
MRNNSGNTERAFDLSKCFRRSDRNKSQVRGVRSVAYVRSSTELKEGGARVLYHHCVELEHAANGRRIVRSLLPTNGTWAPLAIAEPRYPIIPQRRVRAPLVGTDEQRWLAIGGTGLPGGCSISCHQRPLKGAVFKVVHEGVCDDDCRVVRAACGRRQQHQSGIHEQTGQSTQSTSTYTAQDDGRCESGRVTHSCCGGRRSRS